MIYLAFLDDGHGMETPGKRTPFIAELGRSIKENEFNRAVVKLLESELKRSNVHVVSTAPHDHDVPLKERTDYANKIYWQYCSKYGKENVKAIFVSIHYNALDGSFAGSDPSGISLHIWTNQMNKESGDLARSIEKHIKSGTDQNWRGIKENDFHVLRETVMPALLSENGFMDNKREALLMLDQDFQKEVAIEHAEGICDYFRIEYVEAVIVAENKVELADKFAREAQNFVMDKDTYISDGSRPRDPITRQEVWVMLFRFFKVLLKLLKK